MSRQTPYRKSNSGSTDSKSTDRIIGTNLNSGVKIEQAPNSANEVSNSGVSVSEAESSIERKNPKITKPVDPSGSVSSEQYTITVEDDQSLLTEQPKLTTKPKPMLGSNNPPSKPKSKSKSTQTSVKANPKSKSPSAPTNRSSTQVKPLSPKALHVQPCITRGIVPQPSSGRALHKKVPQVVSPSSDCTTTASRPTSAKTVSKKSPIKVSPSNIKFERKSSGAHHSNPTAPIEPNQSSVVECGPSSGFGKPDLVGASVGQLHVSSPVVRVSRFASNTATNTALWNCSASGHTYPLIWYWNERERGPIPLVNVLALPKAVLVCRVPHCTQHASLLTVDFAQYLFYFMVDHPPPTANDVSTHTPNIL